MCHIWLCWNVSSMSVYVWCDRVSRSTALSVDRRATPAPMNTNRSVTRSSAIRTKRRCKTNPSFSTKRSHCVSNWNPQMSMESPPESVASPRKSASEADASVEDSKAEPDKPAPVRRQSCSSTNRGKAWRTEPKLACELFSSLIKFAEIKFEANLELQSLHVTCFILALNLQRIKQIKHHVILHSLYGGLSEPHARFVQNNW